MESTLPMSIVLILLCLGCVELSFSGGPAKKNSYSYYRNEYVINVSSCFLAISGVNQWPTTEPYSNTICVCCSGYGYGSGTSPSSSWHPENRAKANKNKERLTKESADWDSQRKKESEIYLNPSEADGK